MAIFSPRYLSQVVTNYASLLKGDMIYYNIMSVSVWVFLCLCGERGEVSYVIISTFYKHFLFFSIHFITMIFKENIILFSNVILLQSLCFPLPFTLGFYCWLLNMPYSKVKVIFYRKGLNEQKAHGRNVNLGYDVMRLYGYWYEVG